MLSAPKNQTIDPDQIARELLEQLSGLPLVGVAGDPNGLLERANRPGFGRWLTHAAKARGCTNPIRLRGEVLTVQPGTGVVLDRFNTDDLPDRVLYKPCGTRIASRCPSCAEVYRWDTYQLLKAGLVGGKGVPESVASHPAVFVTLTAPSFGLVHSRVLTATGQVRPCRARREKPVCPHGKPLHCNMVHAESEHRLGRPLCLDCYDHQAHVVWNHLIGKLWDRTMRRTRRAVDADGPKRMARVTYAKVAEYQKRGVVHLHALVRFDGYDPDDPDAILPPPFYLDGHGNHIPMCHASELKTVIEQVAATTALRTQGHPDNSAGWDIRWGAQVRVDIITTGLPGGELTERHVAGYMAKYATKATEIVGVNTSRIDAETIAAYADQTRHVNRLITESWELGLAEGWDGLRHWAHRLGFPGHFSTKSRKYSTTLTALRHARRPQNRIRVSAIDGDPVELTDAHDEETTLVIGQWKHVGNGWKSSGDAALAAMAADAARQRVPAGLAASNQT